MARSLLVTGGAGFIGVNFVYHWVVQHPQDTLVVLDALTYAGNRNSLHVIRQKAVNWCEFGCRSAN